MPREEVVTRLEKVLEIFDKMDGYLKVDVDDGSVNSCQRSKEYQGSGE